jgi:REP element-mobilizing transposase RayT
MITIGRSHRLRSGRISIEGQIYLLTSVTKGRLPLFGNFQLGCVASRALTQPRLWGDAKLIAWVLMPDHMHLLVQLRAGATLARVTQRIKAVTSMEIGRATGANGVWEHGYHDRAIRREEDLRDVARYVVANPIRAGLVQRVGDYSFWDAIWVGEDAEPLDP